MSKRIDLTGRVFGRLTVIEYAGRNGTSAVWRCRCECGNDTLVRRDHLVNGDVKSCGCFSREKSSERMTARLTTHGKSRSKIYNVWHKMVQRCENVKDKFFPIYGGRGIKVCERWHRFELFYADMSDGYAEGLMIERIDVNGGYCKENCTWVNAEAQAQNRRNTIKINGVSLKKYCRDNGLIYNTVLARIKRGVSISIALSAQKYNC